MEEDRRFGTVAVREGFLTEAQLVECRGAPGGRPLADVAREKGFLTEAQVQTLREILKIKSLDSSSTAEAKAPSEDVEALRKALLDRGRIGHYTLVELLGEGGSGVVFRAHDEKLKRDVALKMLKTVQAFSAGQAERFFREARNAARLRHPGIVTIYEINKQGDTIYYTMELASGAPFNPAGGTLQDRVRLLEKTSRAAHHAHEHGVVHRDLKPANILVDEKGGPHITDFGLSHDVGAPHDFTKHGTFVGTVLYTSPEQAAGRVEHVDARSDVYALGTILYECLAGDVPFTGATVDRILERVIHELPPRPPGPPDLVTICMKALEKDAMRRYPTAAALADDLARFLAGQTIEARPPTPGYRAWRWLRRRPAAVAVVLVAAAAGGWYWREARGREGEKAYQDGVALWKRGSTGEALERFRRAAGIDPKRADTWVMMGRCEAREGRVEEAGRAWERALGCDPQNGAALFERGRLAVDGWARRRMAEASSLAPGGIWFARPAADEPAKRAEADLQAAHGIEPAEKRYAEGAIALLQGRWRDAPAGLRIYAEQNPGEPGVLLQLALACYLARDLPAAETWLSKEPGGLKVRADLRYLQGKLEEAAAEYARAGLPPEALPTFVVPPRGLQLWLMSNLADVSHMPNSVTWFDHSGRGRHAVQNVHDRFPRPQGAEKFHILLFHFDEKDDALKLPGGFADFGEGLSVFALVKAETGAGDIVRMENGPLSASVSLSRGADGRSLVYSSVGDSGEGGRVEAPGKLVPGMWRRVGVVADPSGPVQLFVDGAVVAEGRAPRPAKADRAENLVGRAFGGDIAELLVYNRALSAAEREAVEVRLSRFPAFQSGGPSKAVAAARGDGKGLRGEYFDGVDFADLKHTRIDPAVDFTWGAAAPHASVQSDHFSSRWTGQVQSLWTEPVTFHTLSDDGVRLWVDGRIVINNWTPHMPTEDVGTIELVAGRRYGIVLEHCDAGGEATMRLSWSIAGQPPEVIPASQLYPPPD